MSQLNHITCGRRALTAAAIVGALVFCAPSRAQDAAPAIDSATGKVLNDAIEALNAERYEEATNGIATLDRSALSPFEQSKVEQILFNVAYKQKQFDEARTHLQRAIDAGGLNAQEISQTRYQSAQLFMQEQRWTEGEAALEEWLATATRPNPAAQYLLAVSRYQQNDFDGALAPARAAVETTEMPQESWLSMLSALHLQAERYHDAVPVLRQLTLVAPVKKTYWLQLSSVYGQLEDYSNAAGIMQLAHNTGLLTEDSELKRLADLLLFTGQPQRAAAVLEEAIADETVTLDAQAYEKLANAWIAAGEFDRAVAPLERGAELALTGALFVRLAEVQVKREDWPAATVALDRAVAKGGLEDPGDAEFLMGVALFEQGRHAAARTSFAEARESPKHRDAADSYLAEIARLTAEGRP